MPTDNVVGQIVHSCGRVAWVKRSRVGKKHPFLHCKCGLDKTGGTRKTLLQDMTPVSDGNLTPLGEFGSMAAAPVSVQAQVVPPNPAPEPANVVPIERWQPKPTKSAKSQAGHGAEPNSNSKKSANEPESQGGWSGGIIVTALITAAIALRKLAA